MQNKMLKKLRHIKMPIPVPSILCRKTTEKDVRHLRPGWRISSPDTEPIIGGYRLDPQSTCKNKVRRPQQGLRTYDI